jgi:flagellar biosynthesis/type III secretory pathway M-ring protein FliF/YscJ
MGNEPFQMVTDNYRRPLSGKEKAAILLGELGGSAESVFEYLSTAELKKLRKSLRSLGKRVVWPDETAVLQENHEWGLRKGLTRPIHTDSEIAAFIKTSEKAEKESGIRDMMRKNPDAIAQALSAWLKEDS